MSIKKIIVPVLTIALLLPGVVLAQGIRDATSNLQGVAAQAGVEDKADLPSIIGSIINGALTLVGLIFMILMVYSGYLWMTARGDDEQVNKAKKIITASIIGMVIVVSAYAITTFVMNRFVD